MSTGREPLLSRFRSSVPPRVGHWWMKREEAKPAGPVGGGGTYRGADRGRTTGIQFLPGPSNNDFVA
jgi:hypothetical protein